MGRKKKSEEVQIIDDSKQKFTCCLCGNISYGHGNDPYPLRNSGRCCDLCNQVVILRRISKMNHPNED